MFVITLNDIIDVIGIVGGVILVIVAWLVNRFK